MFKNDTGISFIYIYVGFSIPSTILPKSILTGVSIVAFDKSDFDDLSSFSAYFKRPSSSIT